MSCRMICSVISLFDLFQVLVVLDLSFSLVNLGQDPETPKCLWLKRGAPMHPQMSSYLVPHKPLSVNLTPQTKAELNI